MPGIQAGQRETRTVALDEFDLRAAESGKPPHLSGYASVFDKPYTIRDFFGEYTEVVAPGAFARTLTEGADVRLLVDHTGLPLARTKSGTLTLAEDKRGLKVDADLDDADPDVQRLLPKMQRGDLNQMSFAFRVRKQQWTNGGGKKPDERRLLDLDLNDGDVSVVTYPANGATTVKVRAGVLEELESEAGDLVRAAALMSRGGDVDDPDLIRRAIEALSRYLPTEPAAPVAPVDHLRRELDLVAVA